MRIAHLTDLHLLEERALFRSTPGLARLRMVGLGRPIDPADRAERALRVVRRALLADPDHLVITGDLTEDGHQDQFTMLAEVLDEAGVDPEATTLVAGNHDAYTEVDAFEQALRGPLQAFSRTSTPGTAVLRGRTAVVALSTAMRQPIVRAAGTLRRTDVEALRTWIGALRNAVLDRTIEVLQAVGGTRMDRHVFLWPVRAEARDRTSAERGFLPAIGHRIRSSRNSTTLRTVCARSSSLKISW